MRRCLSSRGDGIVGVAYGGGARGELGVTGHGPVRGRVSGGQCRSCALVVSVPARGVCLRWPITALVLWSLLAGSSGFFGSAARDLDVLGVVRGRCRKRGMVAPRNCLVLAERTGCRPAVGMCRLPCCRPRWPGLPCGRGAGKGRMAHWRGPTGGLWQVVQRRQVPLAVLLNFEPFGQFSPRRFAAIPGDIPAAGVRNGRALRF